MNKTVVRLKLIKPDLTDTKESSAIIRSGATEMVIDMDSYNNMLTEIDKLMSNDALFLVYDNVSGINNGIVANDIIGKIVNKVTGYVDYIDVELLDDSISDVIVNELDSFSVGLSYFCKIKSENVFKYITRLTMSDISFNKFYLLKDGNAYKRD